MDFDSDVLEYLQELALPLRVYIDKFPQKHHLHAYEYALIDLTFGTGKYEEVELFCNLKSLIYQLTG